MTKTEISKRIRWGKAKAKYLRATTAMLSPLDAEVRNLKALYGFHDLSVSQLSSGRYTAFTWHRCVHETARGRTVQEAVGRLADAIGLNKEDGK